MLLVSVLFGIENDAVVPDWYETVLMTVVPCLRTNLYCVVFVHEHVAVIVPPSFVRVAGTTPRLLQIGVLGVSIVHVALQPSPLTLFPSSHCSHLSESTIPSPHQRG